LIVDALNYIKGYRYQMWCFAKEMETPMCVVHVGTPIEQCKLVNARRLKGGKEETGGVEWAGEDNEEAYEPEVFENLIYRYEEPNGMNRWDSPLFTVLWGDGEPPVQNIWDALVGSEGRGRVVRSHQATVLVSLPSPVLCDA
jgi:protein KTI12